MSSNSPHGGTASRALLGAALSLAAACGSLAPLSEELEQRIAAEAEGLPSIDDRDAVREAGEEVVRGELPWPEGIELPEAFGLEDYVRLALERNPRIRARVRELEALGMRVPQVTSLGDPRL